MALLRLTLLLLFIAAGALCQWISRESEIESSVEFSEYVDFEDEDERKMVIYDLVVTHAPFIRFHKTEGEEGFCFPHNASSYHAQRAADDWSQQCNVDYNSVHNGDIPTYYHAMECGPHLHIAYWNFYGYNHKCDCCSGERDAWWEYIVVKIRDWTNKGYMDEVMFGQKKGWYTRQRHNYEQFEDTEHPVAYVGRAGHGFYHDDGGSNTCCYFEDTRNPGNPDHYMMTWMNLVELRKDSNEVWMEDPSSYLWSGIYSPTHRDDWNLCTLKGCSGSFVEGCHNSGCSKSDIGNLPF